MLQGLNQDSEIFRACRAAVYDAANLLCQCAPRRSCTGSSSPPVRKGKPSGVWVVTHQKMRHAEKELAAQAQASYERMVRDWKAASPRKDADAGVTAGRA